MRIARFDATGGPVLCAVTPAPKRDGAYEVKLWSATEDVVLERWHGNFIDSSDDVHALPLPNEVHDGRAVELVATVAVPPGTGPCTVFLIVLQDGRELERDHRTVAPNTPAGFVNLAIGLEATR